ncbi:hypothetical protein [Natrinema salsiterrestre]|uniref:Zinc ribbon domain-containing protein n=1 Tax=Natrinema salsiterrestre TaxID=2950540 RepID=A0A9Q4L2D1_9EURY|nr:hypothetical protein [Natrinema salsiterrestre]MDF9744680.1 zinc ribbon domain-containing protein [Natrinema salsiterrestre]
MRPPNGSGTDHETLVLLELVAVPIALLATFFTLALAELLAVAISMAIDAAGVGGAVLPVVNVVIGLGTLLVLFGAGGLLVVGYRYCFDSWFDEVSALPVLLVPGIGIAVSVGYSIWTAGSIRLSSWLFFPIAISAYALAYRTIAIDSLRRDRERDGLVAGALTGFPVVVVLLDLASRMIGSGRPIARTLDPVAVGGGTPTVRSVVIAVPLLVTALYGIETLYSRQSRWDGPDWSVPVSRNAISSRTPSARSLPNPRDAISDLTSRVRSDSSGRQPTGAGAGRASSKKARSSSDVVPSSPGTGSAPRSGSTSNDASSSTSSAERAAGTSADDGPSASSTDTSDEDDSSPTTQSEGAGTDDSSPADAVNSAADSSSDGSGSDTRIFVDDFDQYVPDETPVETCPDCEKEIPSDGVYNFCPFCGGDL